MRPSRGGYLEWVGTVVKIDRGDYGFSLRGEGRFLLTPLLYIMGGRGSVAISSFPFLVFGF